MEEIITTGNKGKTVRSDCFISFEMKGTGGIEIGLESKVETMYGNANRKLAKEILERKIDFTIICESPITWKDSLKMKGIFEALGYAFK